jgi:hypothetical protein
MNNPVGPHGVTNWQNITNRTSRDYAEARQQTGGRLLLLDGQVHHDTHAVPMGNYVIGVGNYVIATPSELGNYKIADTLYRGQPYRQRNYQLGRLGVQAL